MSAEHIHSKKMKCLVRLHFGVLGSILFIKRCNASSVKHFWLSGLYLRFIAFGILSNLACAFFSLKCQLANFYVYQI